MSGLTSVNEVTPPSAPASGSRRIYPTASGWTDMDSAGNTYLLGQISGMTAGYVAFGGTTTPLAADPGLFWDNTNKWLGVGAGIGTPVSVLDVVIDAGITPTYPGPVFSRHISAANAMQLVMRKSRNTRASPQAISANDAISNLLSYGHDGSNYVAGGQIVIRAAENWVASTTLGSQIEFYTNAPGATGQRLSLILYANRGMTVGANAVFSNGVLHYLSGALTAGSVNYAIGLLQDTALTAHANSDSLAMVQIAQTFDKGAFTGLASYGMRIYGASSTGAGTIAQNSLLNLIENGYGTANIGLLIGTHPGGTTNYAIYTSSTNGVLFSGGLNIGTPITAAGTGEIAASGAIISNRQVDARYKDATTNVSAIPLIGRHNTSGTAAVGFGAAILMVMDTNGAADRNALYINTVWNTATDATRKAQTDFYIYDTAGRVALSIAATGTLANIGFLGNAPVGKQVSGGLLANVITGLVNLGLFSS